MPGRHCLVGGVCAQLEQGLLPEPTPFVEITSDASGTWGCEAWHETSWFQVQWDRRADHLSIAAKEEVPIILACMTWGHAWRAHQVQCRCDNQVVVAEVQQGPRGDVH